MKLQDLRNFALTNSLFKPTTLKYAIDKLGFVQADPIRAPARAQELILRHRVKDYHMGDLDLNYNKLNLDEDFLYAYGFFSPRVVPLLHPKKKKRLSAFEKKLFEFIKENGKIHPRDLEQHFGKKTERNWWGGNSKATKMALDQLHYYGLLRIAGRENGIRTYEIARTPEKILSDLERAQQLSLLIVYILQPVTEVTFRQALNYLRYFCFDREKYTAKFLLELMIKNGMLVKEKIEGVTYIWDPATFKIAVIPKKVRFLAPFDPVVWDRARFEHFWGWPYRFEAYTPAAKRIRGYYSLPLLWGEEVIGWVNANKNNGKLKIDVGFVEKKPQDRLFEEEIDKEIIRFKAFLSGPEGN